MKLLTVVFPVFTEVDIHYILMGKQADGKKMPGVRLGFGGKCEEGESAIDCARRELFEESGITVSESRLKRIGKMIVDEKEIIIFVTQLDSKIVIRDNEEMVDVRWFDIEHSEEYIHEMLPGDHVLMTAVSASLRGMEKNKEFVIDKSGNKELQEATRHIY